MAFSFDTPKSSVAYPVNVTGTIPAFTSGYLEINLKVTSTAAVPRNDSFYQEVDLVNSTSTPLNFHGTYQIAIVPKLHGSDTVQTTLDLSFK